MSEGRPGRDGARLPASRRAQVAAFVKERGEATVAELVEALNVSADTIRRDLDELANRGMVTRTHGGAMHQPLARADRPFVSRLNQRRDVKERIGQAAAELVEDGQTLIVNGGTTTYFMACAIRGRKGLTIVTNNLRIPADVQQESVSELYLLGGTCRFSSLVTVGPVEFPGTSPHQSHRVMADVAFIGVGGISSRGGLTTTNLHEAQMMRDMMDSAGSVVILADSSKFERHTFAQVAELSMADLLVTDETPPPTLAAALDDAGVEVRVAG